MKIKNIASFGIATLLMLAFVSPASALSISAGSSVPTIGQSFSVSGNCDTVFSGSIPIVLSQGNLTSTVGTAVTNNTGGFTGTASIGAFSGFQAGSATLSVVCPGTPANVSTTVNINGVSNNSGNNNTGNNNTGNNTNNTNTNSGDVGGTNEGNNTSNTSGNVSAGTTDDTTPTGGVAAGNNASVLWIALATILTAIAGLYYTRKAATTLGV